MFRGDTDFTQTKHLDRWDDAGDIRFVFGIDAMPNLIALAEQLPAAAYSFLERPVRAIETAPRQRPERHKARIVRERGFETIHTAEEMVAEFAYRPTACDRDYRVVVLRKRLVTEKGQMRLFEEYRYFFFITNDRDMPADQVVLTANGRCDQENLIAQLKGGRARPDDAGGRPDEQLGVHGDGEPGVEPEGVGGAAGARVAAARREAPCREADAVADGVPDLLRGGDRDALPGRPGWPSAGVSVAVVEPVAGRLPAAGGAAPRLLAVLRAANPKPGSGCPGPCWPSSRRRGWMVKQKQ